MDVCTENMKTDFMGVPAQLPGQVPAQLPDRPASAPEVDVDPRPASGDLWESVRPYLLAPRAVKSLGRLGHYELLEVLGQGGFGIVLKAIDEKLQRLVAIKILSPHLIVGSPHRKYFLREARTAAKVQHENVVRIYAVEELPLPYIVMEYIAGPTLQNRIDAAGPLAADDIVRLGRQMALGLAAAHAQNLIHRDIKPANILLEGEGDATRVKIADFGIARASDDAAVTGSNLIVGTPMYMSPEQAGGEPLDLRSDLFSLGGVLYTMACGRPPYCAGSGLSVIKRVIQESPRPIAEIKADVPAGLCAIITRLMGRHPGDRFNSATETADRLATCLDPVPQISARRRWGGLVAALALVATFAAGVLVRDWQSRQAVETPAVIPAPIPAAPIAPVKNPEPDPKIVERDAWRQQLAAVPGSEKTRLFRERLRKCNPNINLEKVFVHLNEDDEIRHVAIHGAACPDITPLNGLVHMDAVWIDNGAGIPSFEPLRGLPLKFLHCPESDATDLSPLVGASLETLKIWGWKGSDLSPLRGMPLENLNVGHSDVSDLTPLRGMPLKYVGLNRSKVSDLSVLAGMKLEELLVEETLVRDISLVRGMPMNHLAFRQTQVTDTSPLRGLPLKALSFDYNHERDKELLASFTAIDLINYTPSAQFRANLPRP